MKIIWWNAVRAYVKKWVRVINSVKHWLTSTNLSPSIPGTVNFFFYPEMIRTFFYVVYVRLGEYFECFCYEERLSPVVAAEAAYPDRQAAALLSNGSVLKAWRHKFIFVDVINCNSKFAWIFSSPVHKCTVPANFYNVVIYFFLFQWMYEQTIHRTFNWIF